MKKNAFIALLIVLMLTFAIGSGCSRSTNQAPAGGIKNPDTFVIASDSEPTLLDPAIAFDPMSSVAIQQVCEPLVTYEGNTSNIIPVLAESWEPSDGGRVWTFKLRSGVKFSDGTPFNAEAVKINLERILNINQGGAWIIDMIESIAVVDDLTVRITLEYPYVPFLQALAAGVPALFISPKAIADHEVNGDLAAAWLRDHMVGTGPYILESWVIGQGWSMSRNENYWGGWNGKHVSKIDHRVVKESSSRMLMLENGDADFGDNITRDTLQTLINNPDITVVQEPSANILQILFNNQRGALRDKKVRQAMAYAFSYDDCVNGIYSGMASKMVGPMSDRIWGYDPTIIPYETNIEKAKQLLAEAGYANGGGLRFNCQVETGADDYAKTVELFQSDMAKIGIQINIQQLAWATMRDMLDAPETAADIFISGYYPDYLDPDNALYVQYHSEEIGNINQSFYINPEMDRLLERARRMTVESERTVLYHQIQQIVNEDSPVIFVLVKDSVESYRSWVKGFVLNPILPRKYYSMYKE